MVTEDRGVGAFDRGVGVARPESSTGTEALVCEAEDGAEEEENEKNLCRFIIEKRRKPDLVLVVVGVGEEAWNRASSCASAACRDKRRGIMLCAGKGEGRKPSVDEEIGSSKEVMEFRDLREGEGEVNSLERMGVLRRDIVGVRVRE